jgi:ribonucleotide monophosphatase NagD (HAD superfamily)
MDVHEFETVVHNGLYDDVKAVCVGWDTAFNFQKLCKASLYIQKGALFVCTNMDHADRVGGFLMPGTGTLVCCVVWIVIYAALPGPIAAALHTATGVPPIVTGA